jgi:anaerobic selenocysteine-containing dehydrogenase
VRHVITNNSYTSRENELAMDRRVFFRIISTSSAAALTTGCGAGARQLMPLLVPEQQLVPGEEQWHASVCTGCGGGCGTLVRVMEGERVVSDKGQPVRERVAAIKKIEGNPLDSISGGKLCARGQAAVQSLYHPDRLRGPMQRTGERGSGQFAPITWDAALSSAAEKISKVRSEAPGKIALLMGGIVGSRSAAVEQFAKALNAAPPVVCSITDHPVERMAAEMVFGWKGQPNYDLANANITLGVGADFLGGWTSPVYYARQFGSFRQGRKDVRGRLVQAESRLSITASSADTWLPVRPGTEPQFLGAVGRLLIDTGLARNLKDIPKAVADVFRAGDVKTLLETCGLEEKRVREVVQELGESQAPLVIGGASQLQSNSLDAVVASHYINVMLGNVGSRGGVLAPAALAMAPFNNYHVTEALMSAQVALLVNANPAYLLPSASGIKAALKRIETVISFGSFLDDSTAWADLILPDHDALESELALVPAVSKGRTIAACSPFIRPLYDTRPVESTLADLAVKMNVSYEAVGVREFVKPFSSEDLTVEEILRQGGVWDETVKTAERVPEIRAAKFEIAAVGIRNDAGQFPLEFQPYTSLQYHDGSASHLLWMQELPDPVSSSIWGLPVELDPKTAAGLRVSNGDIVRVETPHGMIDAPAYVHPGAIPGVVSMPIGDGHTHFGRYASGRGANPLSILAPVYENATGALVLGGTRVKITRLSGRNGWIQFSAPDREERDIHR